MRLALSAPEPGDGSDDGDAAPGARAEARALDQGEHLLGAEAAAGGPGAGGGWVAVLQEGDILHLVMREQSANGVNDVLKKGPEDS